MRALLRWLPLLLVALPAAPQTVTGPILGIVTDPSGAVIPRASVIATNQAAGFVRSGTSDDEGNYRLSFLPPGAYRLEAKIAGFGRMLREGIAVQADQRVRVDFALTVGQATQTVEVNAGTPLVQASDATVGDV